MPAQTRAVLKGYFERGDRPTSAQFSDVMDSFALVGTGANSLSIASAASGLVRASAQTGSAQGTELGAGWVALLSAATTVLRVRALGAGAVGSALFGDATEGSARANLGFTSAGEFLHTQATPAGVNLIVSANDDGRNIVEHAGGSAVSVILPSAPTQNKRFLITNKLSAGATLNVCANRRFWTGSNASAASPSAIAITQTGGWALVQYSTAVGQWTIPARSSAISGVTAAAATTAQASAGTNVSAALTPGRARFSPWAAKAWAVFEGSAAAGVNCSIRSNYNVSTVSGINNGVFRITWGSAFPTRHYGLVAMMNGGAAGSVARVAVPASVNSQNAADVQLQAVDQNNAFVLANPNVSAITVVAYSR